MSSKVETIEYFYGVYLLYCMNPQYKGRTYIGFTVDPIRRIKQHNKGTHFGGASKTSNKGPWKMVLIVHGFPNDIIALRFEWAWQNPTSSRRLQHLPRKKRSEKMYDYCLRILSEMLRVGPWNRLPLTVRWLEDEFCRDFPPDKIPPVHMPICYGPVASKQIKKRLENTELHFKNTEIAFHTSCFLCFKPIMKEFTCLNPKCDMTSHINCLSNLFMDEGDYIPISGNCPKCSQELLWGDLVRKYRGCYDVPELEQSKRSTSEESD